VKTRIGFARARVQNTTHFKESEYPEAVMTRNDLDPLILDLLEWIGREPRSYADVIDAWRTSCPRLTVWEDAIDRGFAVREHVKGCEVMIRLTAAGRGFLREHGRIVRADTNPAIIAGLDPRLSGLDLMDKAHGVDSSRFWTSASVPGHEWRSSPCRITIQYSGTF
jgi:hypothetical protein